MSNVERRVQNVEESLNWTTNLVCKGLDTNYLILP